VLAPHHAEDAELGKARLAAQKLLESLVFLSCDAVIAQYFGSDSRSCQGAHEGKVYCRIFRSKATKPFHRRDRRGRRDNGKPTSIKQERDKKGTTQAAPNSSGYSGFSARRRSDQTACSIV
jgi:hypothetical protein